MSTAQLPREGTTVATPHQLAWLRTQLDEWQREGLLDAGTASSIWGRYRASRRVSVGRLLLALGGAFVGIGLLWLVAANLDQLSPLARFLTVVAIWLAFLAGGEGLAARRGHGARVPAGLVLGIRLVAALAVGAVVFQAAQSLQVPAYEPSLVGYWAGAALIHAYGARSLAPLLVGLPAGLVWLVWQVTAAEPSGLVLVVALLLAAVIATSVAALHTTWLSRFAAPYRELGATVGLVGLFAAALPFIRAEGEWTPWLVVAVVGAAVATGAAVALAGGVHRLEAAGAAAVALAGTGLVLWDPGTDVERLDAGDWLHAVVGVAVYVVVAVGVAVLGTLHDSWRLTAVATVAIVAFTTTQSFAVFAQIVEGAWLFVVLGLVFAGTGFLFDRARREVAAALKGLKGEDR